MSEYKNISRSEFPAWQGWKIIDKYWSMNQPDHIKREMCDNNIELQEFVAQFYQGGKSESK